MAEPGNGIDIAAVYQLLGTVAANVAHLDGKVTAFADDMTTVKLDLAALRETLTHYHTAVIGHGVLFSDLEARVRRIEQVLKLPPSAA